MYETEVPFEEMGKVGDFTVTLASCGNPDYRQNPDQSLPGVPNLEVKVECLASASKACRKYIEDNALGGGNWIGGSISHDGKVVAQVSYNGRVWYPTKNATRETGDKHASQEH